MATTSILFKPLLDKLLELMDAWTDTDGDEVFTLGTKEQDKNFRKRFNQPRKSVPIGHFPCYFYYVKLHDIDWGSFPNNITGMVSIRVVFYKQIWDTDNADQTLDMYYWGEELSWLVNENRRWDGACSDGVQNSKVSSLDFDFVAEGGNWFMLTDMTIDLLLKIDMV